MLRLRDNLLGASVITAAGLAFIASLALGYFLHLRSARSGTVEQVRLSLQKAVGHAAELRQEIDKLQRQITLLASQAENAQETATKLNADLAIVRADFINIQQNSGANEPKDISSLKIQVEKQRKDSQPILESLRKNFNQEEQSGVQLGLEDPTPDHAQAALNILREFKARVEKSRSDEADNYKKEIKLRRKKIDDMTTELKNMEMSIAPLTDAELASMNADIASLNTLIQGLGLPKLGEDFTNSLNVKMIWINDEDGGFWMAETKVTAEQANDLGIKDISATVLPPHLACDVRRLDARTFCATLTVRDRSKKLLPEKAIYSLPSIKQWRRAGSKGNDMIKSTMQEGVSEWTNDNCTQAILDENRRIMGDVSSHRLELFPKVVGKNFGCALGKPSRGNFAHSFDLDDPFFEKCVFVIVKPDYKVPSQPGSAAPESEKVTSSGPLNNHQIGFRIVLLPEGRQQ